MVPSFADLYSETRVRGYGLYGHAPGNGLKRYDVVPMSRVAGEPLRTRDRMSLTNYRVVHCGTGYAGKMALRILRQQPNLKLVGHYVSSPEKAGRDSGELVGQAANGVVTTNSWDEVIGLKADVLTYFADSVRREREAIEDVVPFLQNGTNVVSVSAWGLGHRATVPPDLLERIDAACKKGNSSCYFTSVDPGWVTSDLAIASLTGANRIDSIRLIEFGNFTSYPAEYACREYFGFGQPPGFRPIMVRDKMIEQMWEPTLHRIADVLDVKIGCFKAIYETGSVDYDIKTAFGMVKAGTAAVVRFELQALDRGRPFVVLEHIDHVLKDLSEFKENWSKPNASDTAYRIEVHGDPRYDLELQCKRPSDWCATPVINCIPALVAAAPGLLGPLDLPRYWSRNVTARLGPWP
jgi:hypothetical protein